MSRRHYTFTNIHAVSGIRTQALRHLSQCRYPLYWMGGRNPTPQSSLLATCALLPSRRLTSDRKAGLQPLVESFIESSLQNQSQKSTALSIRRDKRAVYFKHIIKRIKEHRLTCNQGSSGSLL
ncbi:hypothetical protein TNCV_76501 [Trichonephila clavipes]|nr:hypothetical protein TNCV_76501 [Trichonephila clavipes]